MAVTTVSNVNDEGNTSNAAPIANEQEVKPVSGHDQEAESQAKEATTESAPEQTDAASADVEPEDLHAEDETDDGDHQTEGEKGKDGKRRSDFQKRIDRFTRKSAQQEQEIQALRRELESLRGTQAQQQPAKVQSSGEPQLEDFDTYTEWQMAHNRYLVQEELKQRDEQARMASVEDGFRRRFQESGIDLKEYQEALEDLNSYNVPQPDKEVVMFMLESEVGPQISYYYATHPEEAKRVAGLSKSAQLVEFARTETKLLAEREAKANANAKAKAETKPVPKPSAAPNPPSMVQPGAVPVARKTQADVANDYQAWKKMREEQLKARR